MLRLQAGVLTPGEREINTVQKAKAEQPQGASAQTKDPLLIQNTQKIGTSEPRPAKNEERPYVIRE